LNIPKAKQLILRQRWILIIADAGTIIAAYACPIIVIVIAGIRYKHRHRVVAVAVAVAVAVVLGATRPPS
jgi:cell division protein FtsW (lipid II flippase)